METMHYRPLQTPLSSSSLQRDAQETAPVPQASAHLGKNSLVGRLSQQGTEGLAWAKGWSRIKNNTPAPTLPKKAGEFSPTPPKDSWREGVEAVSRA